MYTFLVGRLENAGLICTLTALPQKHRVGQELFGRWDYK